MKDSRIKDAHERRPLEPILPFPKGIDAVMDHVRRMASKAYPELIFELNVHQCGLLPPEWAITGSIKVRPFGVYPSRDVQA